MCARCGHDKDVHARYVRNLTCCYDCSCFGFTPPTETTDEQVVA